MPILLALLSMALAMCSVTARNASAANIFVTSLVAAIASYDPVTNDPVVVTTQCVPGTGCWSAR